MNPCAQARHSRSSRRRVPPHTRDGGATLRPSTSRPKGRTHACRRGYAHPHHAQPRHGACHAAGVSTTTHTRPHACSAQSRPQQLRHFLAKVNERTQMSCRINSSETLTCQNSSAASPVKVTCHTSRQPLYKTAAKCDTMSPHKGAFVCCKPAECAISSPHCLTRILHGMVTDVMICTIQPNGLCMGAYS